MEKRTLRWLYSELPDLISQGVVPPDVAERIRQHYGEPEAAGSTAKRWAIISFSILGALLIAGGIILLLAHNWEQLTRPARAVISVLPLALSSALGAWLLWKDNQSVAWREGVGTFQTIAIGVAISLVAQTYHLGGRFEEFMLTWSLLALPIAYLLRATLPALLYLVGITVWLASIQHHGPERLWYFPLLLASLPYLWLVSRANRYHPRPVLFGWVLAITISIGCGIALPGVIERLEAWPVLFGGIFALQYLIGTRWWGEAAAGWQRPFQTVGALGAAGLSLAMSFSDAWSVGRWNSNWDDGNPTRATLELCLAAIFPLAAIALWVGSCLRRAWQEILVGALPVLALTGWLTAILGGELISQVLCNLYLLALGIGTLVLGLRARRLGVINAGMAVLAALILCRFFDADLGFVLRGIAFILVGAGFLATNLVLLRWKGAAKA